MKSINIRKITAISALGIALAVGAGEASAQARNKAIKQQQKIIRQEQKLEKQSLKLEQERLRLERERLQAQRARSDRYRVYRNGTWYNTDRRGADLLRQAVNEGYRQGYLAGRADRNARRGAAWQNSSIYRSGTHGYQSYVDRGVFRYYFQQGFERGYQDGYNSQFRYGSYNGGSLNILGTILQQVLNLQQY